MRFLMSASACYRVEYNRLPHQDIEVEAQVGLVVDESCNVLQRVNDAEKQF